MASAAGFAESFGPEVLQDFERASRLEWLETNDFGDFACGTVAGVNTRRQHGLFTFRSRETSPLLLLANLEVMLESGEERFELSANQYAAAIHPQGFKYCTSFRFYPFPEWQYELPGVTVRRRFFIPRSLRCAVISWELHASSPGKNWLLRVRPLLAFRASDSLTSSNSQVDFSVRESAQSFSVAPYRGCPELFIHCPDAAIRESPCWYYQFRHVRDEGLGPQGTEDLFSPCEIVFSLSDKRPVLLALGPERLSLKLSSQVEGEERTRRLSLSLAQLEDDPLAHHLAHAAENFIVTNPSLKIIAGYPSTAHNARDSLLALPGLLLCTKRNERAKGILENAISGQLQASISDSNTLYLVRASELYLDYSRDWDFLRETLYPALDSLVQRYLEPGISGFHMTPDGLLSNADGAAERAGKPVEINALWFHALGLLARWATRRGLRERSQRFSSLRELCGRSFRGRFWNEKEGCLFDSVDLPTGHNDASVRPFQVVSISLGSDLLERFQATRVLSTIEKRLLTPNGLRMIEKAEKPEISPLFVGAYVDAVFRVRGRTPPARVKVEQCLKSILETSSSVGALGHLPEFYGDNGQPIGEIARAAALGEMIRIYAEVKTML